jgi:hypothetical protein
VVGEKADAETPAADGEVQTTDGETQDADVETQEVVLRVPTIDLPEEYRGGIPYGTEIRFAFPSALLHLFSAETEQSLL